MIRSDDLLKSRNQLQPTDFSSSGIVRKKRLTRSTRRVVGKPKRKTKVAAKRGLSTTEQITLERVAVNFEPPKIAVEFRDPDSPGLQHFSTSLNPVLSVEDQLRKLQRFFPIFFSPKMIKSEQLIRLLKQVNLHGASASLAVASQTTVTDSPSDGEFDSDWDDSSEEHREERSRKGAEGRRKKEEADRQQRLALAQRLRKESEALHEAEQLKKMERDRFREERSRRYRKSEAERRKKEAEDRKNSPEWKEYVRKFHERRGEEAAYYAGVQARDFQERGVCITGDSLVKCLDLQSGRSITKPLSTVSVGDLLETGQTPGSDANTKWRRVARLWPAEAESRAVFQLSEGCRVTDNHPVFIDGKWQLPGKLGRVVTRSGRVYGVELEGHVDTVLVGGIVCAGIGVYCGPTFPADGWNIWTRKSTYCDQHFTPTGCAKCRVAVHPNMDFGSVTKNDLQKRFPPY